MQLDRTIGKGLLYGVAAGLCWGVIFLGPELAKGLSGLQFAVLRFLFYGVFSLILLLPRWRRVCSNLTPQDWKALGWLSLIGNLCYYSLVGTAVLWVGVATTSLIVGLIPVLITLAGRKDSNAVPLTRLMPSLICAVAGVALISLHALSGSAGGSSFAASVAGVLCALGALLSWSWYAVSNARQLARVNAVSSHDWSLLTGVVTGAQSLLLAIPLIAFTDQSHDRSAWIWFLGGAGGVALLSSVIGGAFWNQASRLLPLALSGQVLVVETLAALLFAFLWEQRLPDTLEIVAIVLLITGVAWCLNCHSDRTGPQVTSG